MINMINDLIKWAGYLGGAYTTFKFLSTFILMWRAPFLSYLDGRFSLSFKEMLLINEFLKYRKVRFWELSNVDDSQEFPRNPTPDECVAISLLEAKGLLTKGNGILCNSDIPREIEVLRSYVVTNFFKRTFDFYISDDVDNE